MSRFDTLGFMAMVAAISGCARPPDSKPYVSNLELRGVHSVSAGELRRGLVSKPVPLCKPGPNHAYEEEELARDRIRVVRFYEQRGFYATKVVLAEAKPRNQLARDVVIAVEEGPATLIGDVRVFGVDGLDDKTRYRIHQYQLGLRRGQVFKHADYLQFKESLQRVLKNAGYADTVVEGTVDITPKDNLALITVTFHPHGVDGNPPVNAPADAAKPVAGQEKP